MATEHTRVRWEMFWRSFLADPWDSGGSIDLRCGIFRIVFSGTGTDSDCGSIVPGEIISGLA